MPRSAATRPPTKTRIDDLGRAATSDHGADRARFRAADPGLAHRSDPAAGCGRERVVDYRGVWGAEGDLPVRLAQPSDRADWIGADRLLRAAGHVRDPVRAVHGQRGLPGQPDPATRARRRGQQALSHLRSGDQRTGHRLSTHHGVRVRQPPARRQPARQTVRGRPCCRGDPRRDSGALPASSCTDDPAGTDELVRAALA